MKSDVEKTEKPLKPVKGVVDIVEDRPLALAMARF
jgi:hypothetical protein